MVVKIREMFQFVKEVRAEFAKVAWPSMQEFFGSIIIVFIFVAFFMMYLGAVDVGLSKVARFIFQYVTQVA
jgi:preprotein translocase SecE subunit